MEEISRLGGTLVGFAPASRWDQMAEVPEEYRPAAIWSLTRTVIVTGIPMLLPVLESTPSINYQEMYNTSNILLDRSLIACRYFWMLADSHPSPFHATGTEICRFF